MNKPAAPQITEAQLRVIWRAAITAAHNIVCERENRLNDDDGPLDVLAEQREIRREILSWIEPDAGLVDQIRALLEPQK